jgi:cytidylate kinase
MKKQIKIAIDGPAGSGKSTTAKLVASRLGYNYIDTGAMYRAVTYLAIQNNILANSSEIIKLTKSLDIKLEFGNGLTHVFANGNEITEQIRTFEVNQNVSDVSTIEEVRKELVNKQRKMGLNGGVVMEGRDIGTVVFPDAELKVFLTASLDERAVRRAKEFNEKGKEIHVNEIRDNLSLRDKIDSSREVSPLKKGDDYFEVDTSNLSIDEQVEVILNKVSEVLEQKPAF